MTTENEKREPDYEGAIERIKDKIEYATFMEDSYTDCVNVDDLKAVLSLAKKALKPDAVKTTGRALITKLDECDPWITASIQAAYMDGKDYPGPDYDKELEALKALVGPENEGERG